MSTALTQALLYTVPPVAIDAGRLLRAHWRARGVRRIIQANAAWQDRYAGRRVFVLGNGPSLGDFDRSVLAGEKVVVMNNFHLSPWKDEVDIVAHCIAEHRAAPSWDDDEFRASIDGTDSASYWLDISSHGELGPVTPGKQLHYVLPAYEPGLWRAQSFALQGSTLSYQTTAQLAIQVAIHMGFKEVLLVGFDHDWLASRDYLRHFYASTKDRTDVLGRMRYLEIINFMRRMWTIYYEMRRTAERAGVRILNLSSTTCLDVFERRDASSYLVPPQPAGVPAGGASDRSVTIAPV